MTPKGLQKVCKGCKRLARSMPIVRTFCKPFANLCKHTNTRSMILTRFSMKNVRSISTEKILLLIRMIRHFLIQIMRLLLIQMKRDSTLIIFVGIHVLKLRTSPCKKTAANHEHLLKYNCVCVFVYFVRISYYCKNTCQTQWYYCTTALLEWSFVIVSHNDKQLHNQTHMC